MLDLLKPDAVANVLQPYIDRGELSGVVALTWRRSKIIQADAIGWRDIEEQSAIRRDSLFRVASMTKPVTTVAALMLLDDGKLQLSDPVTKWLPELAGMRVLRQPETELEDTVAAERDITVEDLMTHRAGFGYSMFCHGPISAAYSEIVGGEIFNDKTPDEWLQALGSLPLIYQPGDRMSYGLSTDVLGFLAARIAGKPLEDLLDEWIFRPLGMADSGFSVATAKRDRVATTYQFDDRKNALVRVELPILDKPDAFSSGGVGLFSTADDYLRFARLLLNDGEIDGVRLLKPGTVRDMRTNRLTPAQRTIPFIGAPTWSGMGFGLGLGIVDDPKRNLLGCGRADSFTWPGAFGTWWQADPVEDIVMVYMTQHSINYTPESGAAIAGARGTAGRMALPAFQSAIYDLLPESA